jgi:hypothetical protein
MCMIENTDACEVWSETASRASREYECYECRRAISPGEIYCRLFTVFEGESSSFRICQHCRVAANWLERECRGWCAGGIAPDLQEHWHEEYIHTLELGRILVGIRRGWKRNGKLMGLPAVKAG